MIIRRRFRRRLDIFDYVIWGWLLDGLKAAAVLLTAWVFIVMMFCM